MSIRPNDRRQPIPEAIEAWARREFNPKYAELVASGLIDVAAGNREGNPFEREAVERILRAREDGEVF